MKDQNLDKWKHDVMPWPHQRLYPENDIFVRVAEISGLIDESGLLGYIGRKSEVNPAFKFTPLRFPFLLPTKK